MSYDLNIPISATTSPAHLRRTLLFLAELKYTTVALTTTLTPPIPSPLPLPLLTPLPFAPPASLTIYRRTNLVLHDNSTSHRLADVASSTTILSVRPTTESALHTACSTLPDLSLISLDLTRRYPFHFRPKPFQTAIRRGVRFEICYGQAVAGDADARRNFIGNVVALLRATGGNGIVASSEARSSLAVRPWADVVNLLAVWGLGTDRAKEALQVTPRGVLRNEIMRRTGWRGVVDVVDGGETPMGEMSRGESSRGETRRPTAFPAVPAPAPTPIIPTATSQPTNKRKTSEEPEGTASQQIQVLGPSSSSSQAPRATTISRDHASSSSTRDEENGNEEDGNERSEADGRPAKRLRFGSEGDGEDD